MALSKDGNPVIIEYKKSQSSKLITQSLFYLNWIRDHRGDFEIKVQKTLGKDTEIDWSDIRVICIAPNYSRYDLHAIETIETMGVNIELWKYRRFENHSLSLEKEILRSVGISHTKSAHKNSQKDRLGKDITENHQRSIEIRNDKLISAQNIGEEDDTYKPLETILRRPIPIPDRGTLTIAECLRPELYKINDKIVNLRKIAERYGVRMGKDNQSVLIAPTAPELMNILRGTPYQNTDMNYYLKQLPGVSHMKENSGRVKRYLFAGSQRPCYILGKDVLDHIGLGALVGTDKTNDEKSERDEIMKDERTRFCN